MANEAVGQSMHYPATSTYYERKLYHLFPSNFGILPKKTCI